MDEYSIDHPHNEASALINIHNQLLLDKFGWDAAFWIVSDEEKVHKSLAALGRRRQRSSDEDPEAWQVVRLKARRSGRSSSKKTDDCETMAQAGAWIYIFGSQFGSKDGPLDPERHFVARFNESLVEVDEIKPKLKVKLDVVREPFLLHRLVNDAFGKADLSLIQRGEATQEEHVAASMKEAEDDGSKWRSRIAETDWPINVEGATFLPSGRLLLGLRYPVTVDGHPICVEIDGIDRMFVGGDQPSPVVTRVWCLSNVGTAKKPQGIRELATRGQMVHAITGDLDSDPQESNILKDHPDGEHDVSAHYRFEVPDGDARSVEAVRVRRFGKEANVEGLAVMDDESIWYAHDAETIRLTCSPPPQDKRDRDDQELAHRSRVSVLSGSEQI